jgi:hypothetical protein
MVHATPAGAGISALTGFSAEVFRSFNIVPPLGTPRPAGLSAAGSHAAREAARHALPHYHNNYAW